MKILGAPFGHDRIEWTDPETGVVVFAYARPGDSNLATSIGIERRKVKTGIPRTVTQLRLEFVQQCFAALFSYYLWAPLCLMVVVLIATAKKVNRPILTEILAACLLGGLASACMNRTEVPLMRGSILPELMVLSMLPMGVYAIFRVLIPSLGRRIRLIQLSRQPVCAKCGYSLIGNGSGVCPECGTAVKIRMRHRGLEQIL